MRKMTHLQSHVQILRRRRISVMLSSVVVTDRVLMAGGTTENLQETHKSKRSNIQTPRTLPHRD